MTDPAPKTRRAPKGEKRREELLDAALQVFSREGYSGASVARVAAVAGLSVAGLLHHYPSKISLLMGVLQRRDEINQRIADQVRAEKTLCGLLGSLRAINAANANAPGVVRAFTILNAESLLDAQPAWAWFQQRYEGIQRRLQGQFADLVAAGEVRSDVDIPGLVEEILAMMDGLQIQWLRFPERVDLVARFDTYLARVEAAIRT
ncbi:MULTISPECIES: TetR/AcrR family transcriptional regulator [Pseudomonas]|jgi:AcrR family transcriptional regulator|uniref:TetR/AcrR family transcriptional regulator n=1 Tax=Pseudomonas rhodesiae TaxID=76760 RepID=A0A8I1JIN4_9PSED|nr:MULTISPECIES: TetR/AcrR family transcriptional regulator [Pseudomonas]OXS19538.1 TetR/AcrR family transcriptional regulator [Pseudomonas fluorescens]MBB4816167.1 AcrR family transcriptional regulator [Pseudomonas rhodesiae]MBI6601681.1 TetR/AcrR family transcriptional regulator [Pseudomonas sp. S4_EA_1b]MBI6627471.1 TetR/AcrR family transcriptional regulator [Pseudomonas rhodesiae]MBX4139429.1 TetR/AcrR family transcriptional regulator [Pseudomonas sp. S5F11]